ncbi:Uncharacterised protein [uncultured archaeon]|nr:Uncharacterised protein [uncultured archaeon]
MSELTIEQLVKIILGILVVVAVVIGAYLFFKNQIIDFFKGLSVGTPTKFLLTLIK